MQKTINTEISPVFLILQLPLKLEYNNYETNVTIPPAKPAVYQAALINKGPPKKHSGAITPPMMPQCASHASFLAPKPSLYGIDRTMMPDPIIAANVAITDCNKEQKAIKRNI